MAMAMGTCSLFKILWRPQLLACTYRTSKKGTDGESFLIKRPKIDYTESNKGVIAKILGVNASEIEKTSKKQIVEATAVEVFNILKNSGIRKGQMIYGNGIFMLTPNSIQNYIDIMNESCFYSIGLGQIINFRNVHKQKLEVLYVKRMAPPAPDIIKNYIKILEIERPIQHSIWDGLPEDTSRMTLAELRKFVICKYIGWKLNVEVVDVEKTFPKYLRLALRSLRYVKENLRLVHQDLGFSSSLILKNLYLLSANPMNTACIIRYIDSLGGIPLRQILLSRPKILMSQYKSLLEIDALFKKHEIPESSIALHPELFTLSPKTIQERLEEIDAVPEFRPLKSHPRIARLIYYQNNARKRLDYLRKVQTCGVSLHVLSTDRRRFKIHMEGEKSSRGRDLKVFLSQYLKIPGITEKNIHDKLKQHKNWLGVCSNLKNIKESLQFLEKENFSHAEILETLPLVLYPKQKIEEEYKNVLESKEAKPSDKYFLHMVLYFIERLVHFSGDGIWNKGIVPFADDRDILHSYGYVEEGLDQGAKVKERSPNQENEDLMFEER